MTVFAYCREPGHVPLLESHPHDYLIQDREDTSTIGLFYRPEGSKLQVAPEGATFVFAAYSVFANFNDFRNTLRDCARRNQVVRILDWGVASNEPSWPMLVYIVSMVMERQAEYKITPKIKYKKTYNPVLPYRRVGKKYWPEWKRSPLGYKKVRSRKYRVAGFLLAPDDKERRILSLIGELHEAGLGPRRIALSLNHANIVKIGRGNGVVVGVGAPWGTRGVKHALEAWRNLAKSDSELARYFDD